MKRIRTVGRRSPTRILQKRYLAPIDSRITWSLSGDFDKRAIRRRHAWIKRRWAPGVSAQEGGSGAGWTSLARHNAVLTVQQKTGLARVQTNDPGPENKWQWLSKRERGAFVDAPHYRLLEIFHIRASWRGPIKKNWSSYDGDGASFRLWLTSFPRVIRFLSSGKSLITTRTIAAIKDIS